ncbi:hypothetical protein EJB05_35123, partial [Eragrostis curvula]
MACDRGCCAISAPRPSPASSGYAQSLTDRHSVNPGLPTSNARSFIQYKQLTLEEAVEQMSRRSSASRYERWMMKVAANGAGSHKSSSFYTL